MELFEINESPHIFKLATDEGGYDRCPCANESGFNIGRCCYQILNDFYLEGMLREAAYDFENEVACRLAADCLLVPAIAQARKKYGPCEYQQEVTILYTLNATYTPKSSIHSPMRFIS
jgi:hypothetical protein